MESDRKQLNKEIICRIIVLVIISIILLSIILSKNFFTNNTNLEQKYYKNILNLYVLNDGTLRVEENIKLDTNHYSTYFFTDDTYDEIDYNRNIENLKVYYNNIELDTDNKNINGYYIYKYNNNIIESEKVKLKFSPYNNIEVFLPDNDSNLKIVYELKDYIANYNDISYFQFNLKYGLNVFQNETKINIIMPDNTETFNIFNNIELKNKSMVKDINSSRKELYFTGLKKQNLHLEVIFDKNIVDSNLKINEDKELDIIEKYNKIEKNRLKFYIILFGLLIVMAVGMGIGTTVKYWDIENIGKISFAERSKVKFHYIKILLALIILIFIFYVIIKII